MPRPRRTVAGFCIAVIVLAAFLPGVCVLDYATFEPQWVLLPDEAVVAFEPAPVAAGEQPVALLAILASRGPPSLSLV